MTKRQDELDRHGEITILIMITLGLCALFMVLIVIIFGSFALLWQIIISFVLGIN
jgi:hypothetical protein